MSGVATIQLNCVVIRASILAALLGGGCQFVSGVADLDIVEERPADKGTQTELDAGDGGPDAEPPCPTGVARCRGGTPERCADGQWKELPPCPEEAPFCSAGECISPPSCGGAGPLTGGDCQAGSSCCSSPIVNGGIFDRSSDPAYPATIGHFRLDRAEITVGRFREFVKGYPGNLPNEGDGAHPHVPKSGFRAEWLPGMPLDADALRESVKCDATLATWTDAPGPNESSPMLCLTWFEAFAFCAWDGGRLPTEAEWNYAAAGGDEQRPFPWGSDEPSATLAAFDCTADASEAGICSATDILSVGARSPMGDGRWGQFDLAGNAYEWVYDSFTSPYINPCDNCAESDSPSRVLRGGSFSDEASFILSSSRFGALPHNRTVNFGGRCARDL